VPNGQFILGLIVEIDHVMYAKLEK